jgi:hypothetical protein
VSRYGSKNEAFRGYRHFSRLAFSPDKSDKDSRHSPQDTRGALSTYRFLNASCSSCWAVSFRRGGAVGAMISLGDTTGTKRRVLHSQNHREQRLPFDLSIRQGQAKQSRFAEMLGLPQQQYCQGIWRVESPSSFYILVTCDCDRVTFMN